MIEFNIIKEHKHSTVIILSKGGRYFRGTLVSSTRITNIRGNRVTDVMYRNGNQKLKILRFYDDDEIIINITRCVLTEKRRIKFNNPEKMEKEN